MTPAFAPARWLWVGLVVAVLALWALGILIPVAIPGIPNVPDAVSVGQPVVRFVRDVACAMTLGCVVVGGLLMRPRGARVLGWASAWALVWLAAVVAQVIGTVWEVFLDAPDITTTWAFLTQTQPGATLLSQAILIGLVALLAWAVLSVGTAWIVAVLALIAAALTGLLGHAGLGEHTAASVGLGLHVAAVSVWVGGLVVIVALSTSGQLTAGLLRRFSAAALGLVVVVAETGLLNASLRSGTPEALLSGTYGAFVIGKAVLLLLLVSIGLDQRRRTVPAMDSDESVGRGLLLRFASWEFLVMGVAIGLSVTMVRLGPIPDPGSTQLVDPLAVALLALALPMVLLRLARHAAGRPRGVPQWLVRMPEIAAVLLLVAVVQVAGLGVPQWALGPQVGGVVAIVVLAWLGWLFVAAVAASAHRTAAIVILIVGWPLVIAVNAALDASRSPFTPGLRAVAVAVVVAEALLAAMLLQPFVQARHSVSHVEPAESTL